MIATLTLNPSLDRTVAVPGLARGAVIRATSGRLDPGGKGVNVARALLANGVEARAVLPVGGAVGRQLVQMLAAEGVAMTTVSVAGATRSNLTLSEPDGTVTKINEAGQPLTAAEIDLLADAVTAVVGPGDWVVLSGSLPAGADPSMYARLAERFARAGSAVAVDTSGPALGEAVRGRPALVKPNREELAEVIGHEVRSVADAVEAARVLRDGGAARVLASLGPDGAVLVDQRGLAWGHCAVAARRSSVGAGDCLLAGYLSSVVAGASGPHALATALRWAAAAVGMPGSGVPGPSDVAARHAYVTDEIDEGRALSPT